MKAKLLTFFIFLATFSFALTYTTTATPGTWDLGAEPGTTPSASDDIIINHDWSGYSWLMTDARSNYAGTMTINASGYIEITQPVSNWTGTVDVQAGGIMKIAAAYHVAGGALNVDGYLEVTTELDNDISITGTGEVSYGSLASPNTGSIAGTITLPVEFSKFTGEQSESGNVLVWQTLSEINNDFFEIQRSVDGIEFETIDYVQGAGNSFVLNNYNFLDYEVSGLSFYRLKQVDFDGSINYSHIISIGANNQPNYKIYQKKDLSEVVLLTASQENIVFSVVDLNGSLILNKKFSVKKGGVYKFDIPRVGMFVATVSGMTNYHQKIVIK